MAARGQALSEQSLETPLGRLDKPPPVSCGPQAALREALERMRAQRVGSMLVVDAQGRPLGILTRHDLPRLMLQQVALDTPVAAVMTQPVHSLTVDHTAQDAVLLMTRQGVRHVPVTRDGVAVAMVSERDLFALQRQSLRQVGSGIRAAASVADLQRSAQAIRQLAAALQGQGVQARQLTELISHLNDLLTCRLLEIVAVGTGLAPRRWCWLALGSEGRSEQTIATDQDNALILADDVSGEERAAALAFGGAVNQALDACGYPLCRGGIMAGEPACCLTLRQWRERFGHWIAHGAPEDLLNASIYFDLRPLAGDAALAQALRDEVLQSARATPRFLKQLALNALDRRAPLGLLGGIATDARGTLDLKLQGTAIFVDAARVYALACGVPATNTRGRLEGAGQALGLAAAEYQAWAAAFEFLQMLRLRLQLEGPPPRDAPNRIALRSLNHIDRRILKECLRSARLLQRRLQLDYER